MNRCIGFAKPHRVVFPLFCTMLKKWFISALLEIEKLSQNVGPKLGQKLWKIEYLMKSCIGSGKPHSSVFRFFARYYDAEEEIHQRISWNWEDILKLWPQSYAKNFKKLNIYWKGAPDPQKLTEGFFAFLQDITMLKKWFISAFPEIEKISQTLSPKLCHKWWKIEHLMKRFIGSAKPDGTVFRFFARYYDAEEVIHKPISWNWEDISNSGPKAMPKIIQNWTFHEEVHGIRKTSQSRFSLFCTMLKKWFISALLEIEKLSQNVCPRLGQKLWKIEYLMKSCIGSGKPHRSFFRFFVRYYDAEEVIHKRISWNWENI